MGWGRVFFYTQWNRAWHRVICIQVCICSLPFPSALLPCLVFLVSYSHQGIPSPLTQICRGDSCWLQSACFSATADTLSHLHRQSPFSWCLSHFLPSPTRLLTKPSQQTSQPSTPLRRLQMIISHVLITSWDSLVVFDTATVTWLLACTFENSLEHYLNMKKDICLQ